MALFPAWLIDGTVKSPNPRKPRLRVRSRPESRSDRKVLRPAIGRKLLISVSRFGLVVKVSSSAERSLTSYLAPTST